MFPFCDITMYLLLNPSPLRPFRCFQLSKNSTSTPRPILECKVIKRFSSSSSTRICSARGRNHRVRSTTSCSSPKLPGKLRRSESRLGRRKINLSILGFMTPINAIFPQAGISTLLSLLIYVSWYTSILQSITRLKIRPFIQSREASRMDNLRRVRHKGRLALGERASK